jgi:hypothetical protein
MKRPRVVETRGQDRPAQRSSSWPKHKRFPGKSSRALTVAPPPSFFLTGPEIIQMARREARTGGLTRAEASAIARVVEVVCSPIPSSELFSAFRRVFRDLAFATTPDRAEEVALWTPFEPEPLRKASELAHSIRTRTSVRRRAG